MLAQLFDGAVEGLDGAVGAGDHDTALHDGEDIGCEAFGVGVFGQAGFDLIDTLADGADPALKVLCDELVGRAVFRVDLEGEASEGAAVSAFGLENAAAVAGEDAEDTFDGLIGEGEGGINDHRTQGVEVAFEDLTEEGFFAFEEMVEAAGVDLGVGKEVGHAGSGVASFPEEISGGVDEAVAGGEAGGHGGRKLLTELVYGDLLERPTK